uniref:CSON003238 protein n=1 Tax=Culicoides sonorensis TaxID=179676 RepID=A0A336LSQ1_CULSO
MQFLQVSKKFIAGINDESITMWFLPSINILSTSSTIATSHFRPLRVPNLLYSSQMFVQKQINCNFITQKYTNIREILKTLQVVTLNQYLQD